MEARPQTDPARDLAGALAWWAEAGIDCAFRDEPVSWLTPPLEIKSAAPPPAEAKAAAPRRAAAADAPLLDPATFPADLTAFRDWWLAEPLLDSGRLSGRIAPRGQAGAELMVIVGDPEAEDREALLSGPQGRLLAGFLSAAAIDPAQAYVASVLPRHTPHADWAALAAQGFRTIACASRRAGRAAADHCVRRQHSAAPRQRPAE